MKIIKNFSISQLIYLASMDSQQVPLFMKPIYELCTTMSKISKFDVNVAFGHS